MAYLSHIGMAGLLLASMAQVPAPPPPPLAAAREFYNLGRFDEAIAAAERAREIPADANAAAVVLARAYLERHRLLLDASDLSAALVALKDVDAGALGAADQVEFLVGLGVAVYLDDRVGLEDRYSAAAELFATALGRAEGVVSPEARERILEWWCGALDRQAQFGPADGRVAVYERVLARVEAELGRNDRSAVALYWRVAAARGTGDLERAWGAAAAAWLRARYFGLRGVELRSDLDRFVTGVLLPERAERLTPGADPRPTLELLEAGWREFKAKWQ